ncbi:MAG: lysozyme [Odoribacter sp.]
MRTSEKGLRLIKRLEGLRLEAYKCPAGVVTIGYGHTSTARMGMVITSSEADRLLRGDIGWAERAVASAAIRASRPFTQNQFDALVSFTFNVGTRNFNTSTLCRKALANPDDRSIRAEFGKWVNAGGQRLEGLAKRRADEAELYFS